MYLTCFFAVFLFYVCVTNHKCFTSNVNEEKKHGHGVGLISVRQYTMLTTLLDHQRRQFYSVAAVFDGRIEFPHNVGFSHSCDCVLLRH